MNWELAGAQVGMYPSLNISCMLDTMPSHFCSNEWGLPPAIWKLWIQVYIQSSNHCGDPSDEIWEMCVWALIRLSYMYYCYWPGRCVRELLLGTHTLLPGYLQSWNNHDEIWRLFQPPPLNQVVWNWCSWCQWVQSFWKIIESWLWVVLLSECPWAFAWFL